MKVILVSMKSRSIRTTTSYVYYNIMILKHVYESVVKKVFLLQKKSDGKIMWIALKWHCNNFKAHVVITRCTHQSTPFEMTRYLLKRQGVNFLYSCPSTKNLKRSSNIIQFSTCRLSFQFLVHFDFRWNKVRRANVMWSGTISPF